MFGATRQCPFFVRCRLFDVNSSHLARWASWSMPPLTVEYVKHATGEFDEAPAGCLSPCPLSFKSLRRASRPESSCREVSEGPHARRPDMLLCMCVVHPHIIHGAAVCRPGICLQEMPVDTDRQESVFQAILPNRFSAATSSFGSLALPSLSFMMLELSQGSITRIEPLGKCLSLSHPGLLGEYTSFMYLAESRDLATDQGCNLRWLDLSKNQIVRKNPSLI